MSTLKKAFALSLRAIFWIEETFLCLLLSSMIILACVQIFLRFFFSGGFVWADSLLRYMVLWAGLFGAAVATKNCKHINIDIISHLLPDRFKPMLQVLLNLFSAGVCSALTYAAITFVRDEATYGGRGLLNIPSWGLNLVFPLAFGIISLRFIILTFNNLGFIFSHHQLPTETE
ncbi:MAG: TRAP transporter small permease [Deltaproteobacteria bacterium]|nr:TRAP transporter small permease [Deltaproteobacteria bacterium]